MKIMCRWDSSQQTFCLCAIFWEALLARIPSTQVFLDTACLRSFLANSSRWVDLKVLQIMSFVWIWPKAGGRNLEISRWAVASVLHFALNSKLSILALNASLKAKPYEP